MLSQLITVYAAGKAMGVPAALLVAICTQESGLTNTTVLNDGGTPSHGICQIKLETAVFMKNQYNIKAKVNEDNLKSIKLNAYWAALYLKYQLEQYKNDWCKAVPAYNAGSFKESRKYPGSAVNYGYIKKVQEFLPNEMKYKLNCRGKHESN